MAIKLERYDRRDVYSTHRLDACLFTLSWLPGNTTKFPSADIVLEFCNLDIKRIQLLLNLA